MFCIIKCITYASIILYFTWNSLSSRTSWNHRWIQLVISRFKGLTRLRLGNFAASRRLPHQRRENCRRQIIWQSSEPQDENSSLLGARSRQSSLEKLRAGIWMVYGSLETNELTRQKQRNSKQGRASVFDLGWVQGKYSLVSLPRRGFGKSISPSSFYSRLLWYCSIFFQCHFSGIAWVLPRSALWSVQKTRTTSPPIRCKTKTNHDLVAHVFPRFRQFCWFYFEFSLALRDIFLYLIGRCYYFCFGLTALDSHVLKMLLIY